MIEPQQIDSNPPARVGIVGMSPLLAQGLVAALSDDRVWELAVMPGFDAADAYVLHPHDEAEARALHAAMPAQMPSLWLGHGPREASLTLPGDPGAAGAAGTAVGLLAREATPKQLRAAMAAVLAGLHVRDAHDAHEASLLWPPGTQGMRGRGAVRGAEPEGRDEVEPLTTRELEVYELLAKGLSNRDIAGVLEISAHTAKFHVGQILAKVGAATRAEAVAIGLRLGLIGL
jgi:DNA-binding CsgD family transcriptional regulator